MATLRARATMTPLDVEGWIRTAVATLEHGRQLTFTDAGVVHPQTGVVHAGWRDLDGTHPREGSRYLVTTVDPAGEREEAAIELVQDDHSGWRARLSNEHASADVTVSDPARPQLAEAEIRVARTGGGYFAGPLAVDATIDLERRRNGVPRQPLSLNVRHRRVRADVDADVSAARSDRWEVAIVVRARGRGLLRPAVAVAGLLARRRLQREVHVVLDDALQQIQALDARLAATSPDSLGRQLVCQLVDETVVETAR